MAKLKANISWGVYLSLKEKYPACAQHLDEIVEYGGPQVFICMDRLDGLRVMLTEEVWRLALRIDKKKFSSYYTPHSGKVFAKPLFLAGFW